jgi:hypothetical protein
MAGEVDTTTGTEGGEAAADANEDVGLVETPTPQLTEEEGGEPDADTQADPDADATGKQATGEKPPAKPDAGKKSGQVPWFQRRIDTLTREKSESVRAAQAIAEENRQLRETLQAKETPDPAAKPPTKPQAPAQGELDVETRAAAIAAQREFDRNCNDIYAKGKEAYPDFDDSLKSYANLGGLTPQFIEATMEAGDAHVILQELSKDMDEASRIMSLTPTRQAVALAKVAAKLQAVPKTSSAPPPIRPLAGGGTSVEKDPEKMPMKDWIVWREKKLKEKRESGLH